ncbi:hypothetical protein JCM10207_001543 [Rhodosporidiobolus poonsookiae]
MASLGVTVAAASALRLVFSTTPLPSLVQHRIELSSPLVSYSRLQEGYHLLTHLDPPLNPYSTAAFHGPPLLVALVGPLTALPPYATHALWTAVDAATAWALARIAQRRTRGTLLEDQGEKMWSGAAVAALYLFHPFSLLTTLARSSVVFSNLFVALALESALSGSLIPAVFFLSLATHFSLYPLLFLPPVILLAYQFSSPLPPTTSQPAPTKRSFRSFALESAAAFGAHQAALLGLSRHLTGNWDFLSSAYGVILTIPDLTPNIGLAWYFFIEMFDHFRAFFLVVFALHPVAYVAPLTYFYRGDPLFAVTLLVGATSLLKSYPTLGDWALFHALLACFSELLPYVQAPLFHLLLPLHALLLLPTFHHLWLYSGSGNANFFYASTLVWAVAMGGWVVEAVKARGRREVALGLGEEGRGKVGAGTWGVVQR